MPPRSPELLGAVVGCVLAATGLTCWEGGPGHLLIAQELTPRPAAASAVTPMTGLVTIESDRQVADNGTGVVTATGNVRILYPDRRVVATARQAQYFTREGRVVLSGDVEVVQSDGHRLQAEQLVYLVQQERLVALPLSGQQVTSRYSLAAPASGEARQ